MDKFLQVVQVFDKHAQAYQDRFMDTSLYHELLQAFVQAVGNPAARVLDAACGPGNMTHYLLQQQPEWDILGTDLSPNMLELARVNNPQATFMAYDLRRLYTLNQRFNGILCSFGLPYLDREAAVQFITDAAQMLEPAGVLYISTMENDYDHSGWETNSAGDKVFVHYHEAGYLESAMQKSGLTVTTLQRQDFPGKDGATLTDLILIAVKK